MMDRSETSSKKLQRQMVPLHNKLSLSDTLFRLFKQLSVDVKLLERWDHLSNDQETSNGPLYLQKAMLADRLQRHKLAEKNYRKAVSQGHSIFAWYRLTKLFEQQGQQKAFIVCLAEILDLLSQEEYNIERVPRWIQDALRAHVANFGKPLWFDSGQGSLPGDRRARLQKADGDIARVCEDVICGIQ